MEQVVVVLNFEGHDADAEECMPKVEAMANQAGVYADPQNGWLCNFGTNAGSDWDWKFTGTASAMKTFLALIEESGLIPRTEVTEDSK
jgi:hypothetical protein